MDRTNDQAHRGERRLQERYGTEKRAKQFYALQVLDRLNDIMQAFIAEREMFFLSTADAAGNCDATLRSGPAGFVQVVDERTLVYPDYRGNGVMASLGNILENGHVGMLFVDFAGTRVGLHVNGAAQIVDRDGEPWVEVAVHEAYIHCSKHIPRLLPAEAERRAAPRGTEVQDGDFFRVRREALGRHEPPTLITTR